MSKDQQKQSKEAAALKENLAEMESNWKRALADYRNLQKRVEEEKEEVVKFANLVLVSQLLPIMDNLEMLWKHNSDEGVKLVIKGFSEVLENSGVEEIKVSQGDLFDPNMMEAVEMHKPLVQGEKVVREVLQKGYKLNGKLIRPARVNVESLQGEEE